MGRVVRMGQMGRSASGRIATSLVSGLAAAPVSYMMGKIVEKWGILDPVAEIIGKWLRIHVPPSAVGWTIGLVVFAALYGLVLWRVWRAPPTSSGDILEAKGKVTDSPPPQIAATGIATDRRKMTQAEYEGCASALQAAYDWLNALAALPLVPEYDGSDDQAYEAKITEQVHVLDKSIKDYDQLDDYHGLAMDLLRPNIPAVLDTLRIAAGHSLRTKYALITQAPDLVELSRKMAEMSTWIAKDIKREKEALLVKRGKFLGE